MVAKTTHFDDFDRLYRLRIAMLRLIDTMRGTLDDTRNDEVLFDLRADVLERIEYALERVRPRR